MRRLAIALLVTFTGAASPARAQTTPYTRIQRSYTADNVLSVLGKPSRPQPGQQRMTFYDVNAGINTNVNCGALRVNFNFQGMIDKAKRIPGQLAGQAQNLIGGLPMLVLCQSSPSLCAEIKNLNYQINEELKALSDTCRAMDSYIDKQAREGRARGWRSCVAVHMDGGEQLSDAQQACNELPDSAPERRPLYTEIARGWTAQSLVNTPQKLLASLLTAVGENVSSGVGQEKYHFLSSVLGEFQLDANGTKLPLFPAQPITVADLAKTIGGSAIDTSCDTVQLRRAANGQTPPASGPDGSVRAWKNAMTAIIQAKVAPTDVDNLEVLDTVNLQPACTALGRALARATLDKLKSESEATMAQITGNPALDPEIRKALDERTLLVTTAMSTYKFEGGANLDVQKVLEIVQKMAADTRERIRQDAATNARGQLRIWKGMDKTRCTGVNTCGR